MDIKRKDDMLKNNVPINSVWWC